MDTQILISIIIIAFILLILTCPSGRSVKKKTDKIKDHIDVPLKGLTGKTGKVLSICLKSPYQGTFYMTDPSVRQDKVFDYYSIDKLAVNDKIKVIDINHNKLWVEKT